MNRHVIVRNREISVVNPVMVQSNVAVDTVTVSVYPENVVGGDDEGRGDGNIPMGD